MHSKAANAFQNAGLIKNGYGFVGQIGKTKIYNVPFHNASIFNNNAGKAETDKTKYYSMLIFSNDEAAERNNSQDNNKERELRPTGTDENGKKGLARNQETILPIEAISKSGVRFVLPDIGNDITQRDIDANQVRITVSFKRYFPSSNQMIRLIFNQQEYQVGFTHRGNKSHIIRLGKDLMRKANIRTNSKLTFEKLGNFIYKLTIDEQ